MLKVHKVQSAFWLGDVVYRKIDTQGQPGLVIGVSICGNENVLYRVAFSDGELTCFELELGDSPQWTAYTGGNDEE